MRKAMRRIGIGLAITMAVIFVTVCFFYANGILDHMGRGQNLPKAAREAGEEISEFITDIWTGLMPEAESNVIEFPMTNANISWNCLNKK